tara:strand:- start:1961 stop:2758 length:798 start_codon:yes stop_codon:yes gene_type:complete
MGDSVINGIKKAMDDNVNAYNSLVKELYEYNKFSQLNADTGIMNNTKYTNKYSGITNNTEIYENLEQIIDSNQELKNQLIEIMGNKDVLLEEKAEIYKNKELLDNILKYKKNKLDNEKSDLMDEMQMKKRNIEINILKYKKNKAEMNILYSIILFSILLILLKFIKMYGLLNDTIYTIIQYGIILYFLYMVFKNIFDIVIRSEHNFDEYDSYWKQKVGEDNVDVKVNIKEKEEPDMSKCTNLKEQQDKTNDEEEENENEEYLLED